MITDNQYYRLQYEVSKIINKREDIVAYYPICVNCYTKTNYNPIKRRANEKVYVV